MKLKSKFPYKFNNRLILRTPAYPFAEIFEDTMPEKLMADIVFMEALYLASPVLYQECIKLKDGKISLPEDAQKIKISLVKYYQRMFSRSTPFGMFSSCSVVDWNDTKTQIVFNKNDIYRHTRLDMHYLCALSQYLTRVHQIRDRLLFFFNSSTYTAADEMRYVDYSYINGSRHHKISAVHFSDYLAYLQSESKNGLTIHQMQKLLMDFAEVEDQEALSFIEEMIDSQLLISELEPAITGNEFLDQIIATLKKINKDADPVITDCIQWLNDIEKGLYDADANVFNEVAVYENMIKRIQQLPVPFEENKLFQTDMFRRPKVRSLNSNLQDELLETISLLCRIAPYNKNEDLSSFATRFVEKYEDRSMPLLQVLDTDTGLGYPNKGAKNLSPITDELILPGNKDPYEYSISWNRNQQWLLNKLINNRDKMEIDISEEDFSSFEENYTVLPPSLSVMFSITEDEKIIFKGASGSSAANLPGRFAHGNKEVNEVIHEIIAEEDNMNSSIIFAEIVHLPEDRVGNILLHPAFRKYEIPFLAKSSLHVTRQIPLQDIMISVINGTIWLRDKESGKAIIPRLSNSHNYSSHALPVYHFLCDMQTQFGMDGIAFNWGAMSTHFPFLPRVVYKNCILTEATWHFQKKDIEKLLFTNANTKSDIESFQKIFRLPRYVVLADNDNELLVDLHNSLSVLAFIKTVKERPFFVLKEYHRPSADTVKDETGRYYANQFSAILTKTVGVYSDHVGPHEVTETIERDFLPGSNWLYYKIYCGTKTADNILINYIQPLIEQLQKEQKISKWFFIRYLDGHTHLRIRFLAADKRCISEIVDLFYQTTEIAKKEGLLWKVQMDTYQRELRRYGNEMIELAESVFEQDSNSTLQFLQMTSGDDREEIRWLWGMRSVDELLNAFGYSPEEKQYLVSIYKNAFAKEFKSNKLLYEQLNKKYNINRNRIKEIMESKTDQENDLSLLLNLSRETNEKMKSVADQILKSLKNTRSGITLNNLLGSFIHMSLNRLFLSEQRLHEMILYDYLSRYYFSAIKIQEQQNKQA